MKILKKMLLFTITLINIISICNVKTNIYAEQQLPPSKPAKVAVILFSFEDPYISLVRKSLEEIQSKNDNNVNYTFFDGKRNQNTQNTLINSALQSDYDLLLVNLVSLDQKTVESVVYNAKQKNLPIILFNTVPFNTQPIRSYNKAIVISTDAEQSGILQGNLVINEWDSNKKAMDKNGDGILQYFILKGPENITVTTARSYYSISTINNAGIKTQEVISKTCDWEETCAKNSSESLFLKYVNTIEAIISNNDAMAIGAIKALQEYRYNTGDSSKYIPVFGIDGIPEAIDLINKGIMAGTVYQDPNEIAQALYTVGGNLVNNNNPLENTNYKFDDTGVTIELPYHEYKK